MNENELSKKIIGAAIDVHQALGPGLLESAYELALVHELGLRELAVERQRPVGVHYKGVVLEPAFRADLMVNDLVIIEIKAVERLLPVHEVQLHTYLRLSGKKLGLLLNFNAKAMRDGIRRVVNNL